MNESHTAKKKKSHHEEITCVSILWILFQNSLFEYVLRNGSITRKGTNFTRNIILHAF